MKREDLVLAAMSPARCGLFSPIQIQKLFFLLDKNIPDAVDGPHFDFAPYHYGPFDKSVYQAIERLAARGLAEAVPGRWANYRLTEAGQARGEAVLAGLSPKARSYVERTVEFVRKLSFTDLVSAIYRKYPEMRENSVFQESR